jgi:hypothetical protein
MMVVHQTARFSNNPMLSHEKSIMCIGGYLLDTCKRGIIYKPDKSKGLECYVDTDFAGVFGLKLMPIMLITSYLEQVTY